MPCDFSEKPHNEACLEMILSNYDVRKLLHKMEKYGRMLL